MPAPIDATRILNAALAVWRDEGYRNATTRKVAERAGVGEVTLFRRFGDKPALFGAALATEAKRFQTLGANYTGNVEADLQTIVEAYQELLDRNGGIVLDFLIEAPLNPELAKIGAPPLMAIGRIALVLSRYQLEGILKKGDPMLQVTSLLGPLVMRFAVSRAQPILGSDIPADDVVTTFLSGWKSSRSPHPDE